jgi:hypothetical protein
MKTYRFVMWASIAVLAIAVVLPIYTASSIPGSFTLWAPYLRWLTPGVFLVLILGLLPHTSLKLLLSLCLASLALFAITLGFLWSDPAPVPLYSLGVVALSVVAIRWRRVRTTPSLPT